VVIGSKVKPPEEAQAPAVNATNSTDDEDDDEHNLQKTKAAGWHSSLIDPVVDMDDNFKDEAKSMDKVVLSWIVALFKQKDYKLMSVTAARKVMDALLLCPKERGLFTLLLILADLKKPAEEKGIKSTGLKKEAIIEQLLKPVGEATVASSTKRKQPKEEMDQALLPKLTLFKQSYLRQQPGKERAAASIGHRNEEPFLKVFFELFHTADTDGNTEYSFSAVNPVAIF
jgi:hypothetical protein